MSPRRSAAASAASPKAPSVEAVSGELAQLFGEATYTGMSVPHRLSTTSKVCDMPSIHGSSTSSEIGSRPAASARSMTLGDSAMNRPRSGSSRLRSWISVRFVYAATRSSSMESMVMNCMGVPRVLMSSYRRRPDCARPSAHTVCIYGKTPCSKGSSLVSGMGLEPTRLYKIGTSTSSLRVYHSATRTGVVFRQRIDTISVFSDDAKSWRVACVCGDVVALYP